MARFHSVFLGAALVIAHLAPAANAALVRYEFSGTLRDGIPGDPICNEFGDCQPQTFLPPGAPFSGGWTVDVNQIGRPYPFNFPGLETEGTLYRTEQLNIQLGGVRMTRGPADNLYLTTALVPDFTDIWMSGYSSDYTVSGPTFDDDDEPLLGALRVWRIDISFSHDGNDLWVDFALPQDAAFFPAMDVATVMHLLTSFGDVIGDIDSLSATPVPLPPMFPIFSVGIWLVLARGSKGRKDRHHQGWQAVLGLACWCRPQTEPSCRR